MTEYRQLERDFIGRTLDLIHQYEEYTRPDLAYEKHYEVTLLINCLLGLLVFPQQMAHHRGWDSWLTDARVADVQTEWSIHLDYVRNAGAVRMKRKGTNGEECVFEWRPIDRESMTIRQLIRNMRNAVAHGRFELQAGADEQISTITFKADGDFHMELPVTRLKSFIRKLAQSALERLPDTD